MAYTEYKVAEWPVIELLQKLGWKYLPPEELRRDWEEPFDLRALRKAIRRLNSDFITTDREVESIISRLKRLSNDISGNKEFFEWLRGERSIILRPGEKARTIKLIDSESLENNEFTVTRQFEFVGHEKVRFDVVLLVNGIPLVVIEAKRPVREDVDPIEEGINQLQRYARDAPQIFKYLAFTGVTDGLFFKYGWDRKFFEWKEPLKEYEKDPFKNAILQIFNKANFLDIIENFVVFHVKRDMITKRIAWYQQFRSANKIVKRVVKEKEKKGLIWHFQGSGKTLTMLFAAWKLKRIPELENPTILLIVDRIELQNQLKDEFEALPYTTIATSKRGLERKLRKDSREIIITTIQKFGKIEEILNKRENVIIFVDEAHRSQYGKLASRLRMAIPNAFIFGFTGTPIDEGLWGKSTFKTFCHPTEKYLDKYPVKQSVADGATVPIHYLARWPKYGIDREILDNEFFALTEGLSLEEQQRILDRSVRLKHALKIPDRIEKVVKNMTDHFRRYVEPLGFKAMIVTVDRDACVHYKEALDKHLAPEYSEVIFTSAANDPPHLRRYHRKKEEQKRIIEDFKDPAKNPKILIVTHMLITGFDAPILQTMYLDRPLRDHGLLQAIARTNRPCHLGNVQKIGGLVVDYVGIFENLTKALNFSEDEIEGVVLDFKILEGKFVRVLSKLLAMFKGVPKKGAPRESLLLALRILEDEEEVKEFKEKLFELKALYEAISPDPFLVEYHKDYEWIIGINAVYNRIRNREKDILREYGEKTKMLIEKGLLIKGIERDIPIFEIDAEYLDKLERTGYSPEAKVREMRGAIENHIRINLEKNPIYETLSQRLERVLKVKDRKQLLQKLKGLIKEINEIKSEAKRLGLTDEEFAFLNVLRKYLTKKHDEELISSVRALIQDIKPNIFWGWHKSKKQALSIRKKVLDRCIAKFSPPLDTRTIWSMSGELMKFILKYNP